MNKNVAAAHFYVLWHHQGSNSPIGQPIRKMFGIGQHDQLTAEQLEEAKRVEFVLNDQPQKQQRTSWIFENRWGEKYTPKEHTYTAQEAEVSAMLLGHKSIGPNWINTPPAQPAAQRKPLTDDVLQKIISNLEPLLDAKNQSWSQAEKMLIGILGEQPPQRTELICPECKAEVLYECVVCSSNNYPPLRTEQEPVELVRIEHWRQDTMESGHWEKTTEMPRHIAEKTLHYFDQASIITAASEEGPTMNQEPCGTAELNPYRSQVIEEVAQHIEKMTGFGRDTSMTLRDYFAANFMERAQSLCETSNGWDMQTAAQGAYQMADAMLRAREEK
jgi:hypothetical protein